MLSEGDVCVRGVRLHGSLLSLSTQHVNNVGEGKKKASLGAYVVRSGEKNVKLLNEAMALG